MKSAVSFFVYECCIFRTKYDTTDSCESDKLSYKSISCDETFNMIVHIYQITNTLLLHFMLLLINLQLTYLHSFSFYVQSCIHVIVCMCVYLYLCVCMPLWNEYNAKLSMRQEKKKQFENRIGLGNVTKWFYFRLPTSKHVFIICFRRNHLTTCIILNRIFTPSNVLQSATS